MKFGTAEWLFILFCYVIGCLITARPLIHWFQLESYQYPGFFHTLKRQRLKGWSPGIMLFLSATAGIVIIHFCFGFLSSWISCTFLSIWILLASYIIYSYGKRQKEKKKLVYTPRIKRLYSVCFFLWAGLLLLWNHISGKISSLDILSQMIFFCAFAVFLPCWVALGGLIAWPVEKGISEMYFKDAQRILNMRGDLVRIGITGSWGKTSVKYILGSLLSEKYPTLITPASFNTPMGVTKIIRTKLEPGHRIFVAEMGARHVGDIKEMCRLVHPTLGVLTSVGPQHLDTFHTQERITKTKYELVDALPENGSCFFADDNGIVVELWKKTTKEKYLTGMNPERDDIWAEDLHVSPMGSSFMLCTPKGKTHCETVLLGELNIKNIILCAGVCLKLGMTEQEISRGIQKLMPVEHRLELKRNPGGINILDDAFNSNIQGAKQAFQVLKEFPQKRIIVTPGMVELGAKEDELNKEFGKAMGDCCDIAILIGRKRSEALVAGLNSVHFDSKNIFVVNNLEEAAQKLREVSASGDTILFENDLPDNYNEE